MGNAASTGHGSEASHDETNDKIQRSKFGHPANYRFYRAMLAQSAVMRLLSSVRLSVCLSVRNDQVPCSNTLKFFENNFTAK